MAGGSITGAGSDVGGADWCVDGSVPWGIRLGRLRAGVQPAPFVHGAGAGLPARRW